MFLHSVTATTSHIKKQIGISVLNKISVQTDMQMHLQWQLMCPHLPCLHVGQKTKNVYVFTLYVHSSVSTTAFYKEQKVIEIMCDHLKLHSVP